MDGGTYGFGFGLGFGYSVLPVLINAPVSVQPFQDVGVRHTTALGFGFRFT